MNLHTHKTRLIAWISFILLILSTIVYADPPGRVARLSFFDGSLSFLPAGEQEWVDATVNRPLLTSDRLWADSNARVELQLGSASVRLGPSTDMTLLNLDDNTAQFQLSQGSLFLHIRRMSTDQTYEVDTPNLAFVAAIPGDYRVDVDAQNGTTVVSVLSGQGYVYGENGTANAINANQTYLFSGTDLSNSQLLEFALDDFDNWCIERDRHAESVTALTYLSSDMIGYQDLDEYGTWAQEETYGNVWVPNVNSDWAPYRYGHWAWIEPWGWTWIGDEPWGFAPFHYGRWVYFEDHWAWVPGPPNVGPVYSPALVAFIGGFNFEDQDIGWFPLGPNEVYYPPYVVSQNYFININITNIRLGRDKVSHFYNHPNEAMQSYRHRQQPHAITMVPTKAFVQSQPVNKTLKPLPKNIISNTPVTIVPHVTPISASVSGGASPAKIKPKNIHATPVLVKTTPPPAAIPFKQQQPELIKNAGKPFNINTIKQTQPLSSSPVQSIKKITTPSGTNIQPIKPSQPTLSPGMKHKPFIQPTTPVQPGVMKPMTPINQPKQHFVPGSQTAPVISAPPVVKHKPSVQPSKPFQPSPVNPITPVTKPAQTPVISAPPTIKHQHPVQPTKSNQASPVNPITPITKPNQTFVPAQTPVISAPPIIKHQPPAQPSMPHQVPNQFMQPSNPEQKALPVISPPPPIQKQTPPQPKQTGMQPQQNPPTIINKAPPKNQPTIQINEEKKRKKQNDQNNQ